MSFKASLINYLRLLVLTSFSIHNAVGQVDSIRYYNEKINVLSQTQDFSGNETSYIDLLNNLAYHLRHVGQDSMEVLTKKALDLSNLNGYKKGELEALSNFSGLHLLKGNTDKSIQYGIKARNDIALTDFPILEMKVYNQLGQAYFTKQDYPSTYTHFYHALTLAEKFKNDFYQFRMNMNLGTMFNLLEDYDEAIVFYSVAFKSSTKQKNALLKAMISSNLGYLYVQKEDYKTAENYLSKGIEYFKNQHNKEWLAFTYTTLGQLKLMMNNFAAAVDNYEKALKLNGSVTDIKGRADIYYGLAKANMGLNNLAKAETYVNEGVSIYESFKLNTGLERSYRLLYKLKKEQQQLAKSLEYLEVAQKLSIDNSKKKNSNDLKILSAKLNFEKEKIDLKLKNDLELAQQRAYVKWSLVALFFLFIVVLVILNSNNRKKLLNKKLEEQALILNENQLTLSQINRNQDRLFSIIGHDLRGPIISLKEILNLYLEDAEGKVYFEKFAPQLKNDLEQVHFTMDNLLHWGKTQMTGNTISREPITIKKEIEIILLLFRNEIGKKSIIVHNNITEKHLVFADPDQFNIIFRNLLSNAIKFTPDYGEITISTEIKDTNVVIKISDTGVGMSEAAVLKLFKDTELVSTYGTSQEKGTGLGLRLAKEMIVMNNGDIFVKSQPNLGSQFIVELPLALV